MLIEVNMDALVGPSHHFGGLGVGNIASHEHRFRTANPRAAALEGLEKALMVSRLGIPQFLLFPPTRPDEQFLSKLGFEGSLDEQFSAALRCAPDALSATFSGAYIWAANAATVSPAVDCADRRLHLTLANLVSSWHRATEWSQRINDLAALFPDHNCHVIHEPLPSIVPLRDEGAANHMRLSDSTLACGLNIFVYGDENRLRTTQRFTARQTLAACQAIARRHRLDPATTFFLQQHPQAIDAGVFHNDVIATSHKGLLIHHELAFCDAASELERLERTFLDRTGQPLIRRVVSNDELPLADAVRSYLFNSQILSPVSALSHENIIICPAQCAAIDSARRVVQSLIDDPAIPITDAQYVSLDESMSGGGGPACLRLRVTVDQATLSHMPQAMRLDEELADQLRDIICRSYPKSLVISDFTHPDCREQLASAYRELRQLATSRQTLAT